MASWNVVSIFVNVGSEDLMLHNSIGDLHDVLRRFDGFMDKKKREGGSGNGEFAVLQPKVFRWASVLHCSISVI